MGKKAILVLEDGSVYEGEALGAETPAHGEVVFNTSMTGYQEMLTDPSYSGQILVLTYPLVGNYGINEVDFESRRIQVRALVMHEACQTPSHWQSTGTLDAHLKANGIPGIAGVDTRALTRRLRSSGVMMGLIVHDEPPQQALERLKALPNYGSVDYVQQVSLPRAEPWPASKQVGLDVSVNWRLETPGARIVVIDYGVKHNIQRCLATLGCQVTALPCTASSEEVLALDPDGVVLSPGPGDPALLSYAVETVKGLLGRKPLFGICLGHQLLGIALGGRTFKLPFGHRGGNHPVRDLATGRVYITAQNHGYAIDADSLKGGAEPSHVNLNDNTVEGLRHRELPLLSIQYHSEASPGPLDNMYLFERFLELVHDASGLRLVKRPVIR